MNNLNDIIVQVKFSLEYLQHTLDNLNKTMIEYNKSFESVDMKFINRLNKLENRIHDLELERNIDNQEYLENQVNSYRDDYIELDSKLKKSIESLTKRILRIEEEHDYYPEYLDEVD